MRLLDRYILRSFLYNFTSSFVILMFIFIFQTIWLFIDDLAGKGLDIVIILKFLFYLMPNLTEKVLPLTVLLSSILTFGSFAENYEFAAMKASGISLQRSMRSLTIFVVLLGGVTFYFANDVIPASERKIFNLRRNIGRLKPSVAIVEGVFSDFEGADGMNIKVKDKYGEEDRYLKNIVIHKKNANNVNTTIIKAKDGELIPSGESDIMQLILKDGHYNKEMISRSNKKNKEYPAARGTFKTYIINIDISDLGNEDLEKDLNITTDKMKNVGRLVKDIDSLKIANINVITAFSKNITTRMGAYAKLPIRGEINNKEQVKDSITFKDSLPSSAEYIKLFKDWEQTQVVSAAKNSISNILNSVKGKKKEFENNTKRYNLHILSLHKKYALALSCIVLFFVGAPLGAIIRKGGLGLPMVIAIILFLVYYFIGVFAGNYSKEGNIHPILGAWFSTLIMLPLGIVLTKRATADKGMINLPSFKEIFRSFKKNKEES